MNRNAGWLVIAALVTVVGCQQSDTDGSKPAASAGSTEGSGSHATSSPNTTTTTTTTTTGGTSATATVVSPAAKEITMPSGLKYEDLVVGTGEEAKTGMQVSVHYTGWLTDGVKFDTSRDRGVPYSLKLGAGEVIRGWDEGLVGMRVGGKRKLTVPSELGYGARGYPGSIPPNATLVFECELMSAK